MKILKIPKNGAQGFKNNLGVIKRPILREKQENRMTLGVLDRRKLNTTFEIDTLFMNKFTIIEQTRNYSPLICPF